TCPISKTPAGARPSRSCFLRPVSFCPATPVPQASPFFPNSTGKGPATRAHCPPCGRSKSRSSPRIEFQVGATPRINCVQSSGTPSALTLAPSNKQIATMRRIHIVFNKEVIFVSSPVVSHPRQRRGAIFCRLHQIEPKPRLPDGSLTCIAYENI